MPNPIALFPEGQPLPPAFQLQKLYDKQKESPEEERQCILRLSQVGRMRPKKYRTAYILINNGTKLPNG